jgi:hypothetical protein
VIFKLPARVNNPVEPDCLLSEEMKIGILNVDLKAVVLDTEISCSLMV